MQLDPSVTGPAAVLREIAENTPGLWSKVAFWFVMLMLLNLLTKILRELRKLNAAQAAAAS